MSADPNKKSARSFQCRDVLWETFEQMARELECSIDYLINESMKQYARQRSYTPRPPMPGTREGAPGSGPMPTGQGPALNTPPPPLGLGGPPPPPGGSGPGGFGNPSLPSLSGTGQNAGPPPPPPAYGSGPGGLPPPPQAAPSYGAPPPPPPFGGPTAAAGPSPVSPSQQIRTGGPPPPPPGASGAKRPPSLPAPPPPGGRTTAPGASTPPPPPPNQLGRIGSPSAGGPGATPMPSGPSGAPGLRPPTMPGTRPGPPPPPPAAALGGAYAPLPPQTLQQPGPPPPPSPYGLSGMPPSSPAAAAMPPAMGSVPSPTGPTLAAFYAGQRYVVNKDRFIIGRGKQSSDLTIKDPNVSRQHAMVEFLNGQYYMVDMGSTNGVEYNGQRIARKAIAEGDLYRICDHEVRFTYR